MNNARTETCEEIDDGIHHQDGEIKTAGSEIRGRGTIGLIPFE
jgi:hypothetical protein